MNMTAIVLVAVMKTNDDIIIHIMHIRITIIPRYHPPTHPSTPYILE